MTTQKDPPPSDKMTIDTRHNGGSRSGLEENAAAFLPKTPLEQRKESEPRERLKAPDEIAPASSGGTVAQEQPGRIEKLGNLPSQKEIEARSGNYILSYGFPGAGKSTFQSHLARWILEGGEFVPHVAKVDDNDCSTRLINIWTKDWRHGRFPEPSLVDEENMTELRLRAVPAIGQKTPLTFSFFEVSGEDLRKVIPREGPGSIARPLRSFIGNSKIRLMLLLMVDPERPDNDTLFLNLLDYLDQNFKRSVVARMSLLILVPKPKTALANMQSSDTCRAAYTGLDLAEELNTNLLELYLETFIPATLARAKAWPGEWDFARFHMGELLSSDESGSQRYFENTSFEDVSKIFAFIYSVFTGRELGPTRLENFKRFFSGED